jgi:hypothetical protein
MISVAASTLVSNSPLWRIVDAEEADAIGPGWPQFGDKERDPVKTLVTLTKPGYSADGNQAFVNLSFVWSIHGAEARYVLRRAGPGWEVACSHLVFYV